MASRTYRRKVSYSELDWRDYDNLAGRDFHFAEFHGINDSENFVTADQTSFADAKNVYIDSDGQLRQRPPLINKFQDLFSEVVKCVRVGAYSFVVEKYNNTYRLHFFKSNEDVRLLLDNLKSPDVYITSWYDLYLVFTNSEIYGIKVTEQDGSTNVKIFSTKEGDNGWINDLVYIPETEVQGGSGQVSSEAKNLFTNNTKRTYIFSEQATPSTEDLIGKEVTISIGGTSYTFTFERETEKVFVEQIGEQVFDDVQYGYTGNNQKYLGIKYNTAAHDRDLKIYLSSDGIVYDLIEPPSVLRNLNWDEYTGNATDSHGTGYKAKVKPVLSKDGQRIFIFTTVAGSANGNFSFGTQTNNNGGTGLIMYTTRTDTIQWEGDGVHSNYCLLQFENILGTVVQRGAIDTTYINIPGRLGYTPSFVANIRLRPILQESVRSGWQDDYFYDAQFIPNTNDIRAFSPSENFVGFIMPISYYEDKTTLPIAEGTPNPTPYHGTLLEGFIIAMYDIQLHSGKIFFEAYPIGINLGDFVIVEKRLYFPYNNTIRGLDFGITKGWQTWSGSSGAHPVYGFSTPEVLPGGIISTELSTTILTLQSSLITKNSILAVTEEGGVDLSVNTFIYAPQLIEWSNSNLRVDVPQYKWTLTKPAQTISVTDITASSVKLFNEHFILGNNYLYDMSSQIKIPLIVPLDKAIWLDNTGEFEYLYNGYLYTTVLTKDVIVSVVFKGDPEYKLVKPSAVEDFITKTFAIGNCLYQSTRKDNLLYVPENSKVELNQTITGLIKLTEDTLGVFTEDETYLYRYHDDVSSSLNVEAFTLEKTKLGFGLKAGDEIKYTIDGQYILMPTYKGLTALSYQEFLYTTEQTYKYLSENINTYYRTWTNNYSENVRITNYRDWIILHNGSTTLWILDLRNSSWWSWELPYNVKDVFVSQNELLITLDDVSNKSIYWFDFEEHNSCYDNLYGKHFIDWKIKSHKLNFNYAANYKIVKSIMVINNRNDNEHKNICYRIKFTNYKNGYNITDNDTLLFDIKSLTTQRIRLNFIKTNGLQFEITPNEQNTDVQFSTSDIIIKYRITEAVR